MSNEKAVRVDTGFPLLVGEVAFGMLVSPSERASLFSRLFPSQDEPGIPSRHAEGCGREIALPLCLVSLVVRSGKERER